MSEEEIVQFWFEDIAHSRWIVKVAEFDRQHDHWHDTAMGALSVAAVQS